MSLVAALALGTTAYAGLLPAAVQDAVSAAVRPLGIEIPSSIRTEDLPVEVEPMTQGAEKADSAPRLGPVGGEGAVQRRAATPAPEELKEQTKKKASQKRKAEKGAKKAKPGTPAEEAERGDAGRGEGAKGRQGREDDAAADKQDTSNGTRKQGRESARP